MTKARPDKKLSIAIAILLLFGLIALASASAVVGFDRFDDPYFYVKRQMLIGLGVGGVLGAFVWWRGYRVLRYAALPAFVATIVLLLLVFVPNIGQTHNTFARRWIALGPIVFQPSEFAKLAMVIYAAAWLSAREHVLHDFRTGFAPYVLFIGAVVGLVILQPDVGTALILGATLVFMYFYAGGKVGYVLGLIGAAAALLGLLILIEPYRLSRLTTFLDPSFDPQGIGYHANQAFLAIGSGGFWGKGFGQSRAKFQYLPEVTGDSIYAIVAEELGFLVAVALVGLYLYILFRSFAVARTVPDSFGRNLVAGVAFWITFQAILNMSAIVGLAPLTGVPLPFVSYGGTAFAIALAGIAIVLTASAGRAEQAAA